MQCRSCGTEIADKAIICYRCGAGTTDPVRTPVPIGRRGAAGPPLTAVVLPLLLAVVLVSLAPASGHAEAMTGAAGASAVLGVALLITRLVRRR
jgi:hypothetical protein